MPFFGDRQLVWEVITLSRGSSVSREVITLSQGPSGGK